MVKYTVIVTQARVGSTRFPQKVLKKIAEDSLLSIHLRRIKGSLLANKIIVATTHENGAGEIIEIAKTVGVDVAQGSTTDVLDRFYQAVKDHQPDYIVRVTSDCPLVDPHIIDSVIKMVEQNHLDYGSNVLIEEFPDGQDVEVFTFQALERAWKEATLPSDREHVTPYIRRNSTFNGGDLFKSGNLPATVDYHQIRMTVDEPQDLETIKVVVEKLGTERDWITYAQFIFHNPALFSNQEIKRNEGYFKSTNDADNGKT